MDKRKINTVFRIVFKYNVNAVNTVKFSKMYFPPDSIVNE